MAASDSCFSQKKKKKKNRAIWDEVSQEAAEIGLLGLNSPLSQSCRQHQCLSLLLPGPSVCPSVKRGESDTVTPLSWDPETWRLEVES